MNQRPSIQSIDQIRGTCFVQVLSRCPVVSRYMRCDHTVREGKQGVATWQRLWICHVDSLTTEKAHLKTLRLHILSSVFLRGGDFVGSHGKTQMSGEPAPFLLKRGGKETRGESPGRDVFRIAIF